ncbi:MAG: DUF4174 domain-containing protein [Verrucomicrobia bacterium]|nr:DUF4174 domain-containing protein [Verrucomicrobiota bacterium]
MPFPNLRRLGLLLLCGAMLPSDAPAADPDFPLAGAPVGATSVAALGYSRRKLVVFAPEGPNLGIVGMKWNAMRQILTNPVFTAGMAERDTVIILATRENVEVAPGAEVLRVPADALGQARKACGVRPGPGALVLIGKDGGVKDTWTGAVEPEVIFAAIDAMVMRRQEKAAREGVAKGAK